MGLAFLHRVSDEGKPDTSSNENERSAAAAIRRSPFDALFFSSLLGERTRGLCAQQPERIPVILLHLADGSVLDLCHIDQLSPDWIGVMV